MTDRDPRQSLRSKSLTACLVGSGLARELSFFSLSLESQLRGVAFAYGHLNLVEITGADRQDTHELFSQEARRPQLLLDMSDRYEITAE